MFRTKLYRASPFSSIARRIAYPDVCGLAQEYAGCLDRGDPNGFAALFLPNGQLHVEHLSGEAEPESYVGRDQLYAAAAGLSTAYAHTMHFIGQIRTDTRSGTTTGEAYVLAHHLDTSTNAVFVQAIRYRDHYGRYGGRWLFSSRHLSVLWSEVRPVQ